MRGKKRKIAFVVGIFPATSMTFIINQVADLMDRGFDVDVFAFRAGDTSTVSERYKQYRMAQKVQIIGMPENRALRFIKAIPKIARLLFVSPMTLKRALDTKKYGKDASSFKILFWSEPFVGKKYDLIHCHEGHIANQYVRIREIVKDKTPMITSLLGVDVSGVFKTHPDSIYDNLRRECKHFIVMSNNMRERVISHGFDPETLHVLPISVDVESYPFWERKKADEPFHMMSVGRFVEKKGFDDLLRALAIVKKKTGMPFRCSIIGGGSMETELQKMTDELDVRDVVDYKGFMKIEDIIKMFEGGHLYLQPSKTGRDGDTE